DASCELLLVFFLFFFQAEDGIRDFHVTGVQTCALPIYRGALRTSALLARPDRLLGTILVGNNFVNILASSIATVLAIQLWGEARSEERRVGKECRSRGAPE